MEFFKSEISISREKPNKRPTKTETENSDVVSVEENPVLSSNCKEKENIFENEILTIDPKTNSESSLITEKDVDETNQFDDKMEIKESELVEKNITGLVNEQCISENSCNNNTDVKQIDMEENTETGKEKDGIDSGIIIDDTNGSFLK